MKVSTTKRTGETREACFVDQPLFRYNLNSEPHPPHLFFWTTRWGQIVTPGKVGRLEAAHVLRTVSAMAETLSSKALWKRSTDTSLMPPPPPPKRIKRPAKVLDEDDYSAALSDIIARDFFPGLQETRVQQEYMNALESKDQVWIAEAGKNLRDTMTPLPPGSRRRAARNSRFGWCTSTPLHRTGLTPGVGTPHGCAAADTPASVADSDHPHTIESTQKPQIDVTTLSLSAFQAKYTSEDNESFNALLDKQNEKSREKHAYLWTRDNKIPSSRQIAYRAREARLVKQNAEDVAANDSKALIPMTVGATEDRPAKPDSWRIKKPDNTFMFPASSVDEEGIETVAEAREAISKAGPKSVSYHNTRFTPQALPEEAVPSSPSLTAVIAQRAARSETEYSGSETPRVNGYAFVEEDEAENLPQEAASEPTYQDLLAGQVGDATPNPFKIREMQKREDLHHRMVERQAKKTRVKNADVVRTPVSNDGGRTPAAHGGLTPAAKRLLDKMGKTPVAGSGSPASARLSRSKDLWTSTPRRKGTVDGGVK